MDKTLVRNFLVNRSLLHRKAKNLTEYFDVFKTIQVDPIKVVARSHELALWNRVENFKVADLDRALYQERELFEYWLQLFSIIPTKYFPFMRLRMSIEEGWRQDFRKSNGKLIENVKLYLQNNGVTSPRQLNHLPKVKSLFSWTANGSRTAALEYLWDRGEAMIHHRERNQRHYELSHKLLPPEIADHIPSVKESREFLLESNFNYLGIVRPAMLARQGYTKQLALRELLGEWVKSGRANLLDIPGIKTKYYILTTDLEKLGSKNLHTGLNILPPLDPLTIDRQILRDIFDFNYTWEAYVPAAKRKFGYYGMPILYKGNFVGQIELVKENSELRIRNLELKIKRPKEFDGLLKVELEKLAQFVKST